VEVYFSACQAGDVAVLPDLPKILGGLKFKCVACEDVPRHAYKTHFLNLSGGLLGEFDAGEVVLGRLRLIRVTDTDPCPCVVMESCHKLFPHYRGAYLGKYVIIGFWDALVWGEKPMI
jgi:hypothetical protein